MQESFSGSSGALGASGALGSSGASGALGASGPFGALGASGPFGALGASGPFGSSAGSSGAAGGAYGSAAGSSGLPGSAEYSESSLYESSLSPEEQKRREEEFAKISQKLAEASENLNRFLSLIEELKNAQKEQKIEDSKSDVYEAKLEV